jgi:hypothetical protein
MSIAAISAHSFDRVAAVSDLREPPRAGTSTAEDRPRGGNRHQLVSSMFTLLGTTVQRAEAKDEQAVYRFAHALMHDLRRVWGDDDDVALDRQDWADLTARLNALARAAIGAQGDGSAAALSAGSAAELMRVPSSRLIEAFVAMRRALPAGRNEPQAGSPVAALGDFLQRLASTTAHAIAPSGALLDMKV